MFKQNLRIIAGPPAVGYTMKGVPRAVVHRLPENCTKEELCEDIGKETILSLPGFRWVKGKNT